MGLASTDMVLTHGDHAHGPCAAAWSPATQGWEAGTQSIIHSANREQELSETVTSAGTRHKLLPLLGHAGGRGPSKFTWHHK